MMQKQKNVPSYVEIDPLLFPVIKRAATILQGDEEPLNKDRSYRGRPGTVTEVPPAKIAELAKIRKGNMFDRIEYGVRRGLGLVGLSKTASLLTPDILEQVDKLTSDYSSSEREYDDNLPKQKIETRDIEQIVDISVTK